MTVRCSICRRLEPEKLAALDAALRENIPLDELVRRTGLSRSALWRHGRHSVRAEGAAAPQKATRSPKNAVPAPVELAVQTSAQKAPEPGPVDQEASRKRALDRTEQLWGEVSECLQLAREPVTIARPDGSTLEVPVDVRTRSAVVRAGRDVIDLDARLNNLYDPPAAPPLFGAVVFENVILMPKTADLERRQKAKVVDAVPEPAGSITDGQTPDRKK